MRPCHLACHLHTNLFAPCLPSPSQERFDPQLFATVFTSGGSGAPQWLNGLIAEPGGTCHCLLFTLALPGLLCLWCRASDTQVCLPEPALGGGWCGAPACLLQAMLRAAHPPTPRPPCPHRGPPAGVRAGGAVQELAAAQLCHPQNPDAAGAREGGEGLGRVGPEGPPSHVLASQLACVGLSWASCPPHLCPAAGGSVRRQLA